MCLFIEKKPLHQELVPLLRSHPDNKCNEFKKSKKAKRKKTRSYGHASHACQQVVPPEKPSCPLPDLFVVHHVFGINLSHIVDQELSGGGYSDTKRFIERFIRNFIPAIGSRHRSLKSPKFLLRCSAIPSPVPSLQTDRALVFRIIVALAGAPSVFRHGLWLQYYNLHTREA